MDNIRLYNTKAAYDADAASRASTAGSVVSSVDDGTGAKYDGKNVIVPLKAAQVADVVVFDKTDSQHKVIKSGTYHAGSFLSDRFVIGGVVYDVTASEVFVMAKDRLAGARYAQGYKVKLSGLNFSAGGTFKITLEDRETVSGTINFTSSDTLATVTAAINALGHARFSAVAHAAYNCITIEHNDYSGPTVTLSGSSAGIAVSELAAKFQTTYVDTILGDGVVKPASIIRWKGLSTYFAGANFEKFLQYYSASGSADAGLSETSASILKQSAFNSSDNPVLFAKYDGDYNAYMMSEMLQWPVGRGVMRQFNSREMTYALAAKTWTDVDGSVKPAYPSAASHAAYGIVTAGHVTGFEPGCWHCGSVYDFYLTIKDRKLNYSDDVNLSLSAIGGTVHNPGANHWTCCEYSSYNGWIYYGSNGNMNHYNKYISLYGRPLLALKINN